MYLQDDRDLRPERTRKKMEKAFAFMIRVRIPGGVLTPQQWLALDKVARDYGNGTMRLTTRQTVQLHGVIKSNLKATLKAIDTVLLNSIAACGDINRNVMCNVLPEQSRAHAEALALARAISDHLLPHTPAYREIWLDGERIAGGEGEAVEPIYGKTYLPRKFKVVVAVPPSNDVDIFAHDLGYIAITDEAGDIAGWNVTVGGGMGMTHGEPDTYPRIAEVMGFCRTRRRGEGVRGGRHRAARLGRPQEPQARAPQIHDRGPRARCVPRRGREARRRQARAGKALHIHLDRRPLRLDRRRRRARRISHCSCRTDACTTCLAPRSRARCAPSRRCTTATSASRRTRTSIISNVPTEKQAEIERIAREAGLLAPWSGLRRNSMACVALPTCGLALAESERYLPELLDALDQKLAAHGLSADDIVIRMTGCPNGCARPYLAEIGLVGKGPGRYNLYLGAAFDGSRMNKLYAEDLDHAGIVAALDPLFAAYVAGRQKSERFGDFVIRTGPIAASGNGADFHANVRAYKPK